MLVLKTIRKTAAMDFISESHLRRLVAEGKCPGVYSGNRFLVNVTALQEQLDSESRGRQKIPGGVNANIDR